MSVLMAAAQVCTSPADCANLGIDNFIGTPARKWASAAALVALVGVVAGARALVRSRRRAGGAGRVGPVVALVAGPAAAIAGAVVLAVADGGLGTGNGVAGGAIAVVLGLLAAVLGWRARSRGRTASAAPTG